MTGQAQGACLSGSSLDSANRSKVELWQLGPRVPGHDEWYDTKSKRCGRVRSRGCVLFRETIEQGRALLPTESDAITCTVSLACPLAHRTLIMRKLKGFGKSKYTARQRGRAQHARKALTYNPHRTLLATVAPTSSIPPRQVRYTGRVTVPVCGTSKERDHRS